MGSFGSRHAALDSYRGTTVIRTILRRSVRLRRCEMCQSTMIHAIGSPDMAQSLASIAAQVETHWKECHA